MATDLLRKCQPGRACFPPPAGRPWDEGGRLTRKRKRPGGRPRRPVRGSATAGDDPGWVSIDGRLMLVAGYTPGGAPYGVFEDEIDDFDVSDRTASEAPFQ